jgi:hypothetical protein
MLGDSYESSILESLFKKSLRGGFNFHIAHVGANIVIKQIYPIPIPLWFV